MGSNSSDPDGDTLDYIWSQPSSQSIDPSSTSTASTTFTAANPGTYTFTLTVNDGALDHSAEVTLDIAQANRAPTASISVSPDPDSTTLTTATEITLMAPTAAIPMATRSTTSGASPLANQSILAPQAPPAPPSPPPILALTPSHSQSTMVLLTTAPR